MSVTIRYADVGDAEAIAAVHTASLQASYRPLLPRRLAHLVLDPPKAAPEDPRLAAMSRATSDQHHRRCLRRPRGRGFQHAAFGAQRPRRARRWTANARRRPR
jgi:hypothetical protein